MTVFVLFVFGVYGSVHVYAFMKARQALGFGLGAGIALAVFMLFMIAAIFLIRAIEELHLETAARALSYIAYVWMAVLFLFFCVSLAIDLVNVAARIPGWIGAADTINTPFTPRVTFFLSLSLSSLVCLYGYFDAQHIRTERVVIRTDKLPAGTGRLVIAQISDVHLGLVNRCDRLVGILEKVKAEKPDLFVSTGDLVDAQIDHLPGLRELLQDMRTKHGNYAVTGNHEYYAGIERSLEFTRLAGFTVLRGETRDAGPIAIAGVDDRTAVQVNAGAPVTDREALARADRAKKFVLFLKHQPRPDPDAVGLFDLMLSGHTHNGQIWPFTHLVKYAHPLIAGRYDVGKGSVVYTSRGSGTWGPPIRFLAPPQVTVIELVKE